MSSPRRRRRPVTGALLATVLLLAAAVACGGSGDTVSWGGLDLRLPEGWTVFEDGPTYLSVSDGELGEEEGDPGERQAAAFFTREPGTVPDDWRTFVTDVDGELETDRSIEVDGLPATQLVFSHTSNGVPLREMVVVVPSRDLVILMQPVVVQGQSDGREQFEAHRGEFEAILDGIDFGAPVDALAPARALAAAPGLGSASAA